MRLALFFATLLAVALGKAPTGWTFTRNGPSVAFKPLSGYRYKEGIRVDTLTGRMFYPRTVNPETVPKIRMLILGTFSPPSAPLPSLFRTPLPSSAARCILTFSLTAEGGSHGAV
jgi:hypothetical protein